MAWNGCGILLVSSVNDFMTIAVVRKQDGFVVRQLRGRLANCFG